MAPTDAQLTAWVSTERSRLEAQMTALAEIEAAIARYVGMVDGPPIERTKVKAGLMRLRPREGGAITAVVRSCHGKWVVRSSGSAARLSQGCGQGAP